MSLWRPKRCLIDDGFCLFSLRRTEVLPEGVRRCGWEIRPPPSIPRRVAYSTEPLHKQENQTFRPHYANRVTHQASKPRPIELTRQNSNVKSLISVSPPPLRHHLALFSPRFFTVYISRVWVFCLFVKLFLSPLRIRLYLVFLVGWEIKFVYLRGGQFLSGLGIPWTLNIIVKQLHAI
jgi:hypothetical protein